MSRSADPGHFFQTTDSIAASQRRAAKAKNKDGNPLNIGCKILAVLPSKDAQFAFVAGADGQARKIDLNANQVTATYSGPTAPLTSLAVSHAANGSVLFAGCWDKTIHSWSIESGKPLRRYTGHTDFVKCLLVARLGSEDVLITGSADASIIVWDIATGRKLHTLKGHARGVLDLAVDPTSATGSPITLFSADSVREIRTWTVSHGSASAQSSNPIAAHETSVNRLRFDTSALAEDEPECDLWTASSDKTAKRLVRDRNWHADTTLEHPDFVKDIVCAGPWVATACRDEEVRVWDASTGKLHCTYSGHFDEVTSLAVVESGQTLVSGSLDGTLRQWSLDPKAMQAAVSAKQQPALPEEAETKKSMMTAEEEAELAELMDSD